MSFPAPPEPPSYIPAPDPVDLTASKPRRRRRLLRGNWRTMLQVIFWIAAAVGASILIDQCGESASAHLANPTDLQERT